MSNDTSVSQHTIKAVQQFQLRTVIGTEKKQYIKKSSGNYRRSKSIWDERNRMKLYHINDRGTWVKGSSSSILKSDSMELGYGNMNLGHL